MKMGVDAGPSETSDVIISESTDGNSKDSVLVRNDVTFQLLLILWFYKPYEEINHPLGRNRHAQALLINLQTAAHLLLHTCILRRVWCHRSFRWNKLTDVNVLH